jgi:HEAT repeat protein
LKQRAQTDDDSFMRCAAVEELARNFKNDPNTLPILKQRAQNDNRFVRGAAVRELARNFKHDPDITLILNGHKSSLIRLPNVRWKKMRSGMHCTSKS